MANKRAIDKTLAEIPDTDSVVFGASAVMSEQASSPATPSSGYALLYVKTDGNLYFKNDAGTETQLN